MNLTNNLVRNAATIPDRVAVRLDDAAVTYRTLDAGAAHVAGMLRTHGIGPGDRVAIMLPNVPHFAVLYYGILRAGAVVVPMNPLLKEREVAYYLADSGADLLFVWQGFEAEAQVAAERSGATCIVVDPEGFLGQLAGMRPEPAVVDRAGDDTAVILYTSGTTGQPKGAELTHGGLARNIDIVVEDLIHLTEQDVMFGGLPLFHVFGQTCGLNAAIKAGAELTLLPRFDVVKAFEVLVRDGVTIFGGVPTMYAALAQHADRGSYDLAGLRLCVSGGAAMPVEVMGAFEEAFGCVVLEGYGLSETSPVASFNLPEHRKPGSVGRPVDGVEFRIVGEDGAELPAGVRGEIAIRGHNVMKGYWNRPEATAEAITDDWFHTGDIGVRDDDGFYFIVDRKKELIIRGGYNVYPREIEEVLYEHPAVAEAAVIGAPHPDLGEEVAAVVALKPGADTTAEDLREFVKQRVAAYKYPRLVRIVDVLPKGATGKIQKRDLVITPDEVGSR